MKKQYINRIANILNQPSLSIIMILFMMMLGGSVKAASDPIVAKWDFTLDGYPGSTIQNKTANLTANEGTALEMTVDATSGKLADNSGKSRAQFNKNTILKVPVISKNDIVEVSVSNDGSRPSKYVTIGGEPMETGIISHKATETEVNQGYVEIKAAGYPGTDGSTKGNAYIYYVQVTQYPPVYQEKLLYTTDFSEGWEDQSAKTPPVSINKTTTDNQTLTFTLNNTSIDTKGKKEDKYWTLTETVTLGYMMAGKELTVNNVKDPTTDAYAETSELKSITKIEFVQTATGGSDSRGWNVKAICNGDTILLYDEAIGNPKGKLVTIDKMTINGVEQDLNLKNVKLLFYNRKVDQNAFMTSLRLYGLVEVKENVNVTYYDTDGITVLATDELDANNPLKFMEGIEDKVTIPKGSVFRGWFDGTGTSALKVNEGAELSIDLFLYAKVTPEEKTDDGTEYSYDLTKNNFYQEDHELLTINGASWHDNKHGWSFNSNGTIKLQVAKNAHIDLALCQYSKDANITVTDESGKEWGSFSALAAKDGDVFSIDYKGGVPTTLTFSIPKGTYIHSLNQMNYTPVYVTFKLTDRITGITPAKILCDPTTGKAKMPTNELFYRDGWSFTGWSDGTTIYEAGMEYAFEQDVTLTANMVSNAEDLADTNEKIDVTWPFDHKYAPVINLSSSTTEKTMSYTKSTSVNGNKHDVTLMMDVTNGGKITNTDSRINALNNDADGAQVNTKTVFRIPAVYGMTITVHASLKEDNANNNTTTHFGSGTNDSQITISDANKYALENKDATISSDGKTISFIYLGDATEITLTATKAGTTNDWGFFKDITATYPVLPSVEYEKILTNPDTTTFPNEKIDNVGSVTISLKDPDATPHNNTGKRYKVGDVVFIEARAFYGYDITQIKNGKTVSESNTFEYTVGEGTAKIEVSYTRKKMRKVIVKTTNKDLGTVSLTPKYENFYSETLSNDDKVIEAESWYSEDTEVKAASEAATDYILDYWVDATTQDSTKVSESNPYTFKVQFPTNTEDMAAIVLASQYTLGNMGNIIFEIPEGVANGADRADACMGATSMTPDALRNVRSFIIPTSYTLYKSDDAGIGGTLDHWTEKDTQANSYEPGHSYSFRTANETLTLIPVFRDNPTTHMNRLSSSVLRFDFATTPRSYDDPSTNERRMVSGQKADIGNNEKTFWTTQTYVEILEEGQEKSHKRDAAIYCDMGNTGYIRNSDLNDWCAMGPGTTLWVPSGVGSTIVMLTYAKITTTTIDGVIPTLDETRTAEERKKLGTDKAFVYSYTTQKPDVRVPIIIGDDYSYYQWIESTILPANLVNLHTSVDDEVHGAVTNVESASGRYEVKELEDGGHAFHQGDRVRLSFKREFGYELDKIVDPAKVDEEGNPLAVLKIRDDGKVDMVGLNDVSTTTPISQNADGTWGVATGDNKTVFVLKKIEPTEEETEEGERTRYEVEFDITTHRQLDIYFKEKKTYYITYNAGQLAIGTPPESNWVEEGDQFTIPRNTTLYYEGNTLHHWVDDAQKVYEIGKSYSAPAEDLRLMPVFEANKFNVLDLTADATATWYLAKDEGAPTINYEKTAGILITQLTNDKGESIDMRVRLDGTNGKLNNADAGRTERIQINTGSVIEFPSTPNCSVTWVATGSINSITIGGQAVSGNQGNNKEATAVCSGESAIQKIEFTEGIYSRYFTVTYKPQTAIKAAIESLTCEDVTLNAEQIQEQMKNDGHVTFTVSPWKNDEKMPAVSGTATEGGTVTTTTATLTTKECIATVRTAAGIIVETYPIQFEFATPEEGDNPQYVSIDVNGQTSTATTNVFENVARSGVIKVTFSRTMKGTTFHLTSPAEIESTSTMGKTLTFKYWDLPAGQTINLDINPESELFKDVFTDIYGKRCMQDLKLTLNVAPEADTYHHHTFDFIVGEDGTIDEAIEAANNNTKTDGHRYFIFVPDGEYELTGNEILSFVIGKPEDAPKDEKGQPRPDMNGQNNHLTTISKPNISLIGQSKDGTIIYNHPVVEGISYTGTIHLGKDAKDFYAEDLTLENRFDYWGSMSTQASGGAGRAAAFHDQGNRSILKNVALMSWQDTYYSANANADYRGYFENCDLAGVVDWLCGDGDIWFEKCNIIVRDRSGNNIAAPATEDTQEWGYVFNNCSIMPETDNPTQLKGNDWTLARPWQKSPACTYLNTKMYTLPRNYGWNRMSTDLTLRFHEYRSMDGDGNLLSLGTRSLAACSPAPGSDECILNAELADRYTIRNAMGGTDAFEPNELCKQIDPESAISGQDENHVIWNDNLELDDDELLWDLDNRALCYFVFKLEDGKWKYVTNTTENRVSLLSYGSGYYCVRAANQRGGLGAATESIRYILQDPYELTIKQTGDLTEDGKPYGWSTICLPFNAKVPEEVTVYAATAHGTTSETEKVTDFMMTLTPVKVIDSEKGYVVYGPAGQHNFSPTSRSCDQATILTGNPTENTISATNKSGYVLSNKTWGLGFYKFTGTTYAPYKAWLPQSMVSDNVQDAMATGTRAIRFVMRDNTSTGLHLPHQSDEETGDAIYNLSGQKVQSTEKSGIYISHKKGKFIK